ncbi:MAG: choline-sulfatase [Aestuariivita sp.]|nr:choline-sulfatase [Aestuariivita sp.]
MDKHNILIIMADQLAPHFLGAYGHKVARTPHIDSLAKIGTRFDAAYCNSPLCAPSRFAFMTSQHISRIGAYDNASELKASIPTFAHYLNSLGYRTCLSGKMHFIGPDQKHGFKERITTDIYPSDFAWTPNWEKASMRIDKWYHNMQTVKESGEAIATFQTDYDDEVEFAAQRWLIDRGRDRRSGNASPFCLVASFIHPHDPYVAMPEWWNKFSDHEIDLPKVMFSPDNQDPFSRRIMDGIEASHTTISEAEIRKARRAYYANVSYFDSKVGALIKTLRDIDELDNTIVFITADHGDMLGERGLWYKMTFFENSSRVPLIVTGPNIRHGTVNNACSLIDILPTLIEIGGGNKNTYGEKIDGRSLLPLAYGKADPVDEAIAEYCAEMTPWPIFMIRRGIFKYIHCEIDPPQLFNLADDPLELTNLANDENYNDVCQSFADEVSQRWNSSKIREAVIESQRSRQKLQNAMNLNPDDHWDYNPPSNASSQYVRNHMDWTLAAARYRFPPLK